MTSQHLFGEKGCIGEASSIEFLSSEDFKSFADGYYLQPLNKWKNGANGRLSPFYKWIPKRWDLVKISQGVKCIRCLAPF